MWRERTPRVGRQSLVAMAVGDCEQALHLAPRVVLEPFGQELQVIEVLLVLGVSAEPRGVQRGDDLAARIAQIIGRRVDDPHDSKASFDFLYGSCYSIIFTFRIGKPVVQVIPV